MNKSKSHYAGSGFSFEFTDNEPAKATVLARKRAVKSKAEQPVEFKLTSPAKPEEKPEKKLKKSKEPTEPSVILDEILSKDTKFEIPQQLPTVDFTDEPVKRHKKKQTSTVDYANEPVKRFEPPEPKQKKPKNKFSKMSNPFPNDPSKNPKVNKSPLKEEKPSRTSDQGSGSSNSNVFTADLVDSLKIHPFAIRNMKDLLKFTKLTHVQQKSIPPALEGKDLLIRSPTGKYFDWTRRHHLNSNFF